ncbi:MAG: hypothetical protein LBP95_00345 [Deltaproteobacteria bacterium]|nr:hypothetical protein [Deltaproteobacteria bacterium]
MTVGSEAGRERGQPGRAPGPAAGRPVRSGPDSGAPPRRGRIRTPAPPRASTARAGTSSRGTSEASPPRPAKGSARRPAVFPALHFPRPASGKKEDSREMLKIMIGGGRLKDISDLPLDLTP